LIVDEQMQKSLVRVDDTLNFILHTELPIERFFGRMFCLHSCQKP